MFKTWKLWRYLKNPPEGHPFYQRTLHTTGNAIPWYTWVAELIGVLLFVPMIVFTSAVYSMAWVVGISSTIAKERRQGTYDLLALAPGGPLGVSWAACMGCLYRNQIYRSINTRDAWIARLVIIGILLFAVTADSIPEFPTGGEIALGVAYLLAIGAAVYLDHIQSILLSGLTGMIAPTYTTDTFNAQLWGFAVFVGLQMTTYATTIVTAFVILPALLPGNSILTRLIELAVAVGLFYGLREVMIAYLWRSLTARLNADPAEVQAIA
jgi:hypothetical protein